jgi:hypothetical protein
MMTPRAALVVSLSRLVIVLAWHVNGIGASHSTVMLDAYDAYLAAPLGCFCSTVSDSRDFTPLR